MDFYNDQGEVLDKITVDIPKRRFTLLGCDGNFRTIDCVDGDKFISLLDIVRETCLYDEVVYV